MPLSLILMMHFQNVINDDPRRALIGYQNSYNINYEHLHDMRCPLSKWYNICILNPLIESSYQRLFNLCYMPLYVFIYFICVWPQGPYNRRIYF